LHELSTIVRRRQISSKLSPELFEKYKTHTMQVRVGDTVTIMRGDFTGVEGKVAKIDTNKCFIYIEGVTKEKMDGTSILSPIHPSKVMIKNLDLEDKRRKEILDRRSQIKIDKKKEMSDTREKKKRRKNKLSSEEKA